MGIPQQLASKASTISLPLTGFVAEVDAIFVDVPLVAGTVLGQGIKRIKKLSVKGMIYI